MEAKRETHRFPRPRFLPTLRSLSFASAGGLLGSGFDSRPGHFSLIEEPYASTHRYCAIAVQVPLAELKFDPTPKDEHDQVPEADAGPL